MQKLLESLTPLERKILPLIKDNISLNELIKESKLKDVEVLRALRWLESKKIVTLKESSKEIIQLDKNGELYIKKGFPEKRFLKAIHDTPLTLEEIKAKADLDKNEINISLGLLKRQNAIQLGKKINITKQGLELLSKKSHEELFLDKLPIEESQISNEFKKTYQELKNRKEIIRIDVEKNITSHLTQIGHSIKNKKLDKELIEELTTPIIKTSSWKNKTFRRYDINTNPGKSSPGRIHFTNQSLRYVKRIWTDMGFKEMTGNKIQTSFWNFDALFTAQDHPARDLQDTFFIKNPSHGKLPDKKLVDMIKKVHESGSNTGSKGWDYKWDEKQARKLVLRTHTTCLSAKTLANLNINQLPLKYFSIGKVFRNETLDWSHLFEFDQTEGIVIDENANFKHLLGYLKEFFNKMGFEKVRFRPAYFPYVSQGTEVDVYHPIHKKWIELGGAGIMRPEVVIPLMGKNIPVLAWGLGIGRIMMDYYNLTDIRDLHKNDLKQLREIKLWLK